MKTAIIWFFTILFFMDIISLFWRLPVIINVWIGKLSTAFLGLGGIWVAIYLIMGIFGRTSDATIKSHPVFSSIAALIFVLIALFAFSRAYYFVLDDFGKTIAKEQKTLKGGIIDAAWWLTFNVKDARTQDSYEFGINDPAAKDLLLLFKKGKKFWMSNYESTGRSLKYEVQYLRHSRVILSAKIVDSDNNNN